ncbi:MAG: hypothetical protein JSV79_09560 [Armatimonadota bacterium]|nr:MAG: hypothetical protein JSV79_09560 [Armatimonadota bacterium]
MIPKERMMLYAHVGALGAVVVWLLLCFFILVSPRLSRLGRLNEDVNSSKEQLAEMQKEIEDASIAGPPPVGASRFEKFGILANDEEQLFLTDLIDFCTETDNTLNLVRRADVARPISSGEEKERGGARGGSGKSSGGASEVPQPTIERVPHNVNYSGTFLSSFYLLRKLESYKRLLTVERMEVATDNQVGYPRVNGTITIDLYLVKGSGAPLIKRAGEESSGERGAGDEQAASAGGVRS